VDQAAQVAVEHAAQVEVEAPVEHGAQVSVEGCNTPCYGKP
jgi:hypothetical protein